MPKLIEVDAPQALQLPRETAATQGADQAAALGQIGKGAEYMGRALMSYGIDTAKTAASEYRTRLRSLQSKIEREYDVDERAAQFDSRLPALREKVLGSHKFASQSVFDQEAGIYEDDFRYTINEHVQTELLERKYVGLQSRASDKSAFIAEAENLEEASDEYESWTAEVDAKLEANDVSAAQARSLKSDAIVGAINNLQDENPELAGQLLEKYRTYLSPQQYSSFDNAISQSRDINASLLAAESVFEQNPDASVPQLRAALGELPLTPKQRKDAMAQLRQMTSDRETAAVRARDKASRQLLQNTQEVGWLTLDPQEKATRIAAIKRNKSASPPAVATALKIATATSPIVTDQNVFGRLWRRPDLVGTPGNTWDELADRVKPDDWQELEKRAASMRDGTLNAGVINSTLESNFKRYGIDSDDDVGQITLQVRARLRGSKITPDSVQAAFDDIYKAVYRFDTGLFNIDGNEYDTITPGIIAEAEENFPVVVAAIRQREPDLNPDQLAARVDRAMKNLQAMEPAARGQQLRLLEAELRALTGQPAAPAPATPAPEPTQGRPPRIGTFDPLPANFDEPEEVILLGDNS